MRGGFLISVLFLAVQAFAVAARAEETVAPSAAPPTAPSYKPQDAAQVIEPSSQPDSMVQLIRAKLSDAYIRKGANADDLGALEGFYAARTQAPLWVTEMGFSTKAQAALFEIEKADDWGLDASVFELPAADALPKTSEERAVAEIKLDLAILKYARFARGGRVNPPTVSRLFDQAPPLRDPKTVLEDLADTDAPGQYLQSLHPKHLQFMRLHEALLKARAKVGKGTTCREPERDPPAHPQHGALALDAGDPRQRLRVE